MLRLTVFILCLSFSGAVWAGALFINGVRVDGVTNLKLHNVDLEVDAQGDLHVTAKGYTVNVAETNTPKPPAPPAAPPQKNPPPPAARSTPGQATKYYLTMSENGDSQWDLDVYVNGQFVRRFQAGQSAPPVEVTRLVKNGDNTVRFRAVKQEGQVRSVLSSEFVQLTLDADAQLVNGRRELTHVYNYRRTAAETGMFDDSVTFSVR